MIPDFNIKIYRDNSEIYSSPEDHSLLLEFIISIKVYDNVEGRPGEAKVILDNEPDFDIRTGDAIEIFLGNTQDGVEKVFFGEVIEIRKKSTDEDKELVIRAHSWSFLLLKEKFTASYLHGEKVKTILLDILGDLATTGPIGKNEHKIDVSDVPDPNIWRQLDFVGENKLDCIKKLCMTIDYDFYVDPNKKLQFFPSLSRKHTTGTDTLESIDFIDYRHSRPEELLCNKCIFYGKDNKIIPWDQDEYTEAISGSFGEWTPEGLGDLEIVLEPYEKRKGNNAIRVNCTAPPTGDLYESSSVEMCSAPPKTVQPPPFPASNWELVHVFSLEPSSSTTAITLTRVRFQFRNWIEGISGWNTASLAVSVRKGDLGGMDEAVAIWDNRSSSTYTTIDSDSDPWDRGTGFPYSGEAGKRIYILFWYTNYNYEWVIGSPYVCMKNPEIWYQDASTAIGALLTLSPNHQIDLGKKEAPRKLKFSLFVSFGSTASFTSSFPRLTIILYFAGTHLPAIYRGHFNYLENFRWTTIEVPVGSDAEGWEDGFGLPDGILTGINIRVNFPEAATSDDWILIDWLHFTGAKWKGEYEDSTSIATWGIKFKEIFDDTAYSDQSCQTRAKKYVEKYKDLINILDNTVVDNRYIHTFKPGETIKIDLPELESITAYKMAEITWKLTEDFEFEADIVFSLDPITFPVQMYQTSERVRRLEQKYERAVANPSKIQEYEMGSGFCFEENLDIFNSLGGIIQDTGPLGTSPEISYLTAHHGEGSMRIFNPDNSTDTASGVYVSFREGENEIWLRGTFKLSNAEILGTDDDVAIVMGVFGDDFTKPLACLGIWRKPQPPPVQIYFVLIYYDGGSYFLAQTVLQAELNKWWTFRIHYVKGNPGIAALYMGNSGGLLVSKTPNNDDVSPDKKFWGFHEWTDLPSGKVEIFWDCCAENLTDITEDPCSYLGVQACPYCCFETDICSWVEWEPTTRENFGGSTNFSHHGSVSFRFQSTDNDAGGLWKYLVDTKQYLYFWVRFEDLSKFATSDPDETGFELGSFFVEGTSDYLLSVGVHADPASPSNLYWSVRYRDKNLSPPSRYVRTSTQVTLNTWHKVKIYWERGNLGLVRVWVDDDLIFEATPNTPHPYYDESLRKYLGVFYITGAPDPSLPYDMYVDCVSDCKSDITEDPCG